MLRIRRRRGAELAEHGPDESAQREPADPAKKRRRRLIWSAVSVLAVIIVLIGGFFGYAIYRNDQIHRITVRNLESVPSSGLEDILLIGSTSRCALKQQNAAFGLCSQGVTGVNGDVIMLLRLDPVHDRVALLSFPRDTFLPNARPDETNRIDSALAYGPGQIVKVVEQDFGLPVNHYVVLNFDSFQGVVNALGGIDMYFPNKVRDAYSSLNIRRTGCIHLNGFQALAVVRARHMQYKVDGQWNYDGSGDLGRIVRDHEFLRVLASAVAKRSLGNPITDNALFGAILPQLVVDSKFGLHEMVNLVLKYHGIEVNSVPELTLPVVVDPSFDYSYKGYNYGSIVFPSEPQDRAAISSFTKAPQPGRSLAFKSITVSLEGGIGIPSATAATAAELRRIGYQVLATSEVESVGPISETSVIYAPGHLAQGERVLDALDGAVALGEGSTLDHADVTIVTGSDFSVHAPPTQKRPKATAKHATLSARATASVSVPSVQLVSAIESAVLASALNSAITPPTAARVALPSYDPRACPGPKPKRAKRS